MAVIARTAHKRRWPEGLRPTSLWLVAALVGLAVVAFGSGLARSLPATWQLPLADVLDDVHLWFRDARGTHPVYTMVFGPLTSLVDLALRETHALLRILGWPGVLLLTGIVAWRIATLRVAMVAAGCLVVVALMGLWDDAMRTFALMMVAVAVSAIVGVPLGILAGRNGLVHAALRPVLDAMQITPAYVYLLPVVLLFSIGDAAALVATVMFALPPVTRLTALGVRTVPETAIEVGRVAGTTPRQLLWTIRLPHALPAIRLGVNQTIMMALSMAVIAALIGGTGLGLEVFRGLQTLNVGRALDAGIAIVLIGIVLDRITYAAGVPSPERRRRRLRGLGLSSGLIVLTMVVAVAVGLLQIGARVPGAGWLSIAGPANAAEAVIRATLYPFTSAFSAFILQVLLDPLRAAMLVVPWWLMTALVGLLAWRVAGERVAAYSIAALVVVSMLGVWAQTLNTLSQVLVAAILSIGLAVPIGVIAAYNDRVDRTLRPILDTMQMMPAFVYLVPVVYLFNVGRVPGIIASVIYALPPGIRLTNGGIRQVPSATVEAARSAGATRWQLVRTVQLPIAKPTILLGVNQTTMMVLACVIIAGLIGAGGLGVEAVRGLTRGEVGRGIQAGLAIVLVGIILDRVTQALGAADRSKVQAEDEKMLITG